MITPPHSRTPDVWAQAFLAGDDVSEPTVTAWFTAALAAEPEAATLPYPQLLWWPDGRELVVYTDAEKAAQVAAGATPIPPGYTGPVPGPLTITALAPDTAVIGDASFTLHVHGTGFQAASVILFAGEDEPTTFVSATEITTGVDMDVWVGPDAVPVVVRNPDGDSNSLDFTFTELVAGRMAAADQPVKTPRRRK